MQRHRLGPTEVIVGVHARGDHRRTVRRTAHDKRGQPRQRVPPPANDLSAVSHQPQKMRLVPALQRRLHQIFGGDAGKLGQPPWQRGLHRHGSRTPATPPCAGSPRGPLRGPPCALRAGTDRHPAPCLPPHPAPAPPGAAPQWLLPTTRPHSTPGESPAPSSQGMPGCPTPCDSARPPTVDRLAARERRRLGARAVR